MGTHGICSDWLRMEGMISSNYPFIKVMHSTGKFLLKQAVRLIDRREHPKLLGYGAALLIDCSYQK